MPVQTVYQRLIATYGLGSKGEHPNILKKYEPWCLSTKYWCEKCGWEQTIPDIVAAYGEIQWTIPAHCWTYKERWEGRYNE